MEIPQVDVGHLADELDNGARLLDVRELHEYSDAHIEGALLIPLGELGERIAEVPSSRDCTLFVICRSGVRSQRACEMLDGRGIAAANVTGGMLAWIESEREVASGPGGDQSDL